MTSLGAQIRTARLAAGLTQRQLADLLGVVPPAVCRWERTDRIHGMMFGKAMRVIETAKANPKEKT